MKALVLALLLSSSLAHATLECHQGDNNPYASDKKIRVKADSTGNILNCPRQVLQKSGNNIHVHSLSVAGQDYCYYSDHVSCEVKK